MSWRRYPEYKESGVECLEKLPVHWDFLPLKRRLKDGSNGIKIGPFGSMLKLEIMEEQGRKVYGQENIITGDFNKGARFINDEKYSELEAYRVSPGDILITMMGTSGRSKVVPQIAEEGILDSHLLRIRTSDIWLLPDFASLVIDESNYTKAQINQNGKGAIMHGLNSTIIKDLIIAIPPINEQESILSFLDRETAHLDALIEKKQRQIELLEEKRSALISHAVTKGLDPGARMKDSGIEWLGEVPKHWTKRRLSYLVEVSGGSTPSKNIEEYWDGEIPWVSPKDMKVEEIRDTIDHISEQALSETSLKLINPPSILFVVRGMILAHTFPVAIASVPITINQDMKAVKPRDGCLTEYLYYLLNGISDVMIGIVDDSAHGTKALRTELWRSLNLFLPPKDEQKLIIEKLKSTTGSLDRIVDHVNISIQRLQEYRSALITAAVTGQIDVRWEENHDKDRID